ncbi:hypothetical protein SOQ14_04865 [Erythrobacter sp. T5W1-R]|nr:hypothetical protein [Erythrobacter sp. T5W1-R]
MAFAPQSLLFKRVSDAHMRASALMANPNRLGLGTGTFCRDVLSAPEMESNQHRVIRAGAHPSRTGGIFRGDQAK